MYSITFKDIPSDEVDGYMELAIKSQGFAYAFFKETDEHSMHENVFMQLFFTTEHHAILFELKNR